MTPRCCGLALLSMGVAACVAPCTARQTAWNWQSVLKALQQSKSPYAKQVEQMLNSSANTKTFKQTVSCIQAFNSTSGALPSPAQPCCPSRWAQLLCTRTMREHHQLRGAAENDHNLAAQRNAAGKAKCSQKLAPNFCADSTCMDHLASKKCSACEPSLTAFTRTSPSVQREGFPTFAQHVH